MPELPDIAAYITALEPRIVGEPIEHVRLASPFLLRTVEPPIASVEGRKVCELRPNNRGEWCRAKRVRMKTEADARHPLHCARSAIQAFGK